MTGANNMTAFVVFAATIVLAFAFSAYGRLRERQSGPKSVSAQGMNRWLVGLSAGATANSGFVVAGAVGLGYTYGLHWVMLPLAWFVGDLVFWSTFPRRINAFGQKIGANTVADLITSGLPRTASHRIRQVVAVVVICCLGGYTAAQWLAGEKFITGAFGLGPNVALLAFASIIIAYTMIGGFRGSIYTDSYQAVLRLLATTVAIVALGLFALAEPQQVANHLKSAGPAFLQLFPGMSLATIVAFILGYAAAAFGFGLGQPQVLSRYMSAASPAEAQAARWIYLFFVQYTWIAMTLFGVLLRGVMPSIEDGETGLAVFFTTHMSPFLTGVIIADIFATIAATANSLLVASAQTLRYDLIGIRNGEEKSSDLLFPALVVGAGTMVASLLIEGSVVTLALASVSIMGAGLAPSVLVRVLGWRCSATSIFSAILVGTVTAVAWKVVGFDAVVNEALPGIVAGLVTNVLIARSTSRVELVESLDGGRG